MSFTSFFIIALPIFSFAAPLAPLNTNQAFFFTAGNVPPAASTDTVHEEVTRTSSQPVTSVQFFPEHPTPSPLASEKSDHITQSTSAPVVAAYYPDWTASQLPPELVDFDRIDWIDFAFAVPDPTTFTPTLLLADSEDLLHRLVASAHAKNKHVKLSIGGWTGSAHFSDAVKEINRNAFAQDIVAIYHKFDLDGIDIDWEYPGEEGASGNVYSPADSTNFLAFLQLLRSFLPSRARISVATQVFPFMDANGGRMRDVSAFAQVLDWVLLMNYDVWGSSQNPGPNAPLNDACHNSSQPEANAHAAIRSWTAAGFPVEQIMLGLPAYGYVSRSTVASLRTRRRAVIAAPRVDRILNATVGINEASDLPSEIAPSIVTVLSESRSPDSGQVQFDALIAQGALVKNILGTSPAFLGAGGFERHWDICSSTPFLRSISSNQIITYDDPESLGVKAAFAKEAGLLGVNMWDAHGDTQQWDLVDGIRRGLGLK